MLSIVILGPVKVFVDGVERPLRSPRQQAVLLALALSAGQTVRTSRLLAVVWGDHPPTSARSNLRSHLVAVRRSLDDGGPERLSSDPLGYALTISRAELDWLRFSDDVEQSAGAEPAEAVELLDRALRLWTGPVPDHLRGGPFEADLAAIEEARTAAVERRAALLLTLGRAAEAVASLRAAVERHPYRESAHAALVTALHRSGDRPEALTRYAQIRRTMRDDLGLEPGPALRDAHRAVLDDDDDNAAAARPPAPLPGPAGPARTPAQLPAVLPGFVERDEQGRLVAVLSGSRRPGRVVVVHGRLGAGKSVLVGHVAGSLRDRFPDGQLFADLHGSGESTAEVRRVLSGFVRALLGRPRYRVPTDIEELVGLYRTLLADRAVLVVLDGVGTEQQVWPLLPPGPGSAAIVTSRSGLWRVSCTARLRLGPLRPEVATSLLGVLIGARRTRAEPSACTRIVEACGGLALAVRSAGSRLAAAPHRSLDDYANRLDDDPLTQLDDGVGGIRDVLESAYRSWSPAVRAAFSELSRTAGPVFDERTAAAVLGCSPGGTAELIDQLVAADLVDVLDSALYRVPAPLWALGRRLAT